MEQNCSDHLWPLKWWTILNFWSSTTPGPNGVHQRHVEPCIPLGLQKWNTTGEANQSLVPVATRHHSATGNVPCHNWGTKPQRVAHGNLRRSLASLGTEGIDTEIALLLSGNYTDISDFVLAYYIDILYYIACASLPVVPHFSFLSLTLIALFLVVLVGIPFWSMPASSTPKTPENGGPSILPL